LVRPARLALAAVERVATTAQLVTRAALAVLASLRLNMSARRVGGAHNQAFAVTLDANILRNARPRQPILNFSPASCFKVGAGFFLSCLCGSEPIWRPFETC
jgi:hypothetical protein